jgi:hypothetical protein
MSVSLGNKAVAMVIPAYMKVGNGNLARCGALALMSRAYFTHPIIAALGHPLFRKRKRGFLKLLLFHPLYGLP